MNLVFEPYTANDARINGTVPLRTLFADRVNTFAAHLPLTGYFEGTQTNGLAVHAHGAPARTFFTDANADGLIVRGSVPLDVSWASGAINPELALFFAGTGLVTRWEGTQTNDVQITGDLGLTSFLSEGPAAFRARLPLRTWFTDGGAVAAARGAFLVQRPAVYAHMALGTTSAISDQLRLADTPTPDFIHALLDLITFSDRYTQLAQVLQALADGISLADVAAMLWQADLLDSFIASGVPAGMAQITVMLADTFDVSDAAGALSEILAAIADGFYVTLTLNTGADTYTAWVMTPETKAMRSYSNFPFNSYAMLGGQFLGVGAAGIYRLGGSTDAGAAIRSAIRTGLLSFGSQGMKAVSRAYLGATTSGALLLRVQATTQTGADIEQTYRMVPAVTNAPREHLVDVGRGFRSVYWTFELANDTNGATFEVHNWHVLPVSLTRRLI